MVFQAMPSSPFLQWFCIACRFSGEARDTLEAVAAADFIVSRRCRL
jgi:hypothetical protein